VGSRTIILSAVADFRIRRGGEEARLKRGAKVDVIVEADSDATTKKRDKS